jgi:membrane fusion protein (multidrug efflux system)
VAAETAHANFQRQKNLFEEGVISRAQFENAEVLYEAARAQFTSAKENLRIAKTGARAEDKESLRLAVEMAGAQRRIAETNLAHTNIVAPYAGGLLKRMIDVGDFVAPGVAAFELVSTDGLKVEFYVPVDKIELIAVGQEATVLLDRHEAPLDATVSHVVASADPDTRLFKVNLALPRGSDVRANEFAEVAIRWLLGDGTVVVPTGAILAPASDEPYVFTVQDGKARRVPVSIGLRNGTCAQIIEPLVGGETVIVSGQTYVADGTPVRANSFDEPCDTPVDGNTESAGAAQ